MKQTFAFILIVVFTACGSQEDGLNAILGTEKGHFQGVSIGDKYEKVAKKTNGKAVATEEGLIACEYDEGDVSVVARYDFDGDILYSIQADLFFPDSSTLRKFENALINQYSNSYGELTEDGGFFVWQENNEVEFTLADESIEFGEPKLSLTIYYFGY